MVSYKRVKEVLIRDHDFIRSTTAKILRKPNIDEMERWYRQIKLSRLLFSIFSWFRMHPPCYFDIMILFQGNTDGFPNTVWLRLCLTKGMEIALFFDKSEGDLMSRFCLSVPRLFPEMYLPGRNSRSDVQNRRDAYAKQKEKQRKGVIYERSFDCFFNPQQRRGCCQYRGSCSQCYQYL